jgi:3-oxoacyl-(acyl-carrier-protein) synthase
MTELATAAGTDLAALRATAAAAGLTICAAACWPETADDEAVKPIAGFIESDFSPLLAQAAERALQRHPVPDLQDRVTAIVLVTAYGDVASATHVAQAVDLGRRASPLLFFQSVPNAVAGYLAARWRLTGPIVCVGGAEAGLDIAAALIEDADADEALVVCVDLGLTGGGQNRATAILVKGN